MKEITAFEREPFRGTAGAPEAEFSNEFEALLHGHLFWRGKNKCLIPESNAVWKHASRTDNAVFMKYGQFGRACHLGDYAPTWANRIVLDRVARDCKSDPKIRLDLTFLLRNSETSYQSVIKGKPFNREDPGPQILKAREEAQRIINRYVPETKNPY